MIRTFLARTVPTKPAVTAVAMAALLIGAGCGRSAPEGALGPPSDVVDPAAAGIRVVSDNSVVPPAPTTVATAPTSVTTVTAGPVSTGSYVIQPGDSLSVIAEQFGVSLQALSEANGITDANAIQPGQELIIPGGAAGDTTTTTIASTTTVSG